MNKKKQNIPYNLCSSRGATKSKFSESAPGLPDSSLKARNDMTGDMPGDRLQLLRCSKMGEGDFVVAPPPPSLALELYPS